MAKPVTLVFLPLLSEAGRLFWPHIRALSHPYYMWGRERNGGRREKKRREGKLESWKALLHPHSTGYQGINRVLKALGGEKWMFFREREKGERKRIEMENGGVRKLRMYIYVVSLLCCHSVLIFTADTRTDSERAGSEYKEKWLLHLPPVTRKLAPVMPA